VGEKNALARQAVFAIAIFESAAILTFDIRICLNVIICGWMQVIADFQQLLASVNRYALARTSYEFLVLRTPRNI
jgi:hypothetical protein